MNLIKNPLIAILALILVLGCAAAVSDCSSAEAQTLDPPPDGDGGPQTEEYVLTDFVYPFLVEIDPQFVPMPQDTVYTENIEISGEVLWVATNVLNSELTVNFAAGSSLILAENADLVINSKVTFKCADQVKIVMRAGSTISLGSYEVLAAGSGPDSAEVILTSDGEFTVSAVYRDLEGGSADPEAPELSYSFQASLDLKGTGTELKVMHRSTGAEPRVTEYLTVRSAPNVNEELMLSYSLDAVSYCASLPDTKYAVRDDAVRDFINIRTLPTVSGLVIFAENLETVMYYPQDMYAVTTVLDSLSINGATGRSSPELTLDDTIDATFTLKALVQSMYVMDEEGNLGMAPVLTGTTGGIDVHPEFADGKLTLRVGLKSADYTFFGQDPEIRVRTGESSLDISADPIRFIDSVFIVLGNLPEIQSTGTEAFLQIFELFVGMDGDPELGFDAADLFLGLMMDAHLNDVLITAESESVTSKSMLEAGIDELRLIINLHKTDAITEGQDVIAAPGEYFLSVISFRLTVDDLSNYLYMNGAEAEMTSLKVGVDALYMEGAIDMGHVHGLVTAAVMVALQLPEAPTDFLIGAMTDIANGNEFYTELSVSGVEAELNESYGVIEGYTSENRPESVIGPDGWAFADSVSQILLNVQMVSATVSADTITETDEAGEPVPDADDGMVMIALALRNMSFSATEQESPGIVTGDDGGLVLKGYGYSDSISIRAGVVSLTLGIDVLSVMNAMSDGGAIGPDGEPVAPFFDLYGSLVIEDIGSEYSHSKVTSNDSLESISLSADRAAITLDFTTLEPLLSLEVSGTALSMENRDRYYYAVDGEDGMYDVESYCDKLEVSWDSIGITAVLDAAVSDFPEDATDEQKLEIQYDNALSMIGTVIDSINGFYPAEVPEFAAEIEAAVSDLSVVQTKASRYSTEEIPEEEMNDIGSRVPPSLQEIMKDPDHSSAASIRLDRGSLAVTGTGTSAAAGLRIGQLTVSNENLSHGSIQNRVDTLEIGIYDLKADIGLEFEDLAVLFMELLMEDSTPQDALLRMMESGAAAELSVAFDGIMVESVSKGVFLRDLPYIEGCPYIAAAGDEEVFGSFTLHLGTAGVRDGDSVALKAKLSETVNPPDPEVADSEINFDVLMMISVRTAPDALLEGCFIERDIEQFKYGDEKLRFAEDTDVDIAVSMEGFSASVTLKALGLGDRSTFGTQSEYMTHFINRADLELTGGISRFVMTTAVEGQEAEMVLSDIGLKHTGPMSGTDGGFVPIHDGEAVRSPYGVLTIGSIAVKAYEGEITADLEFRDLSVRLDLFLDGYVSFSAEAGSFSGGMAGAGAVMNDALEFFTGEFLIYWCLSAEGDTVGGAPFETEAELNNILYEVGPFDEFRITLPTGTINGRTAAAGTTIPITEDGRFNAVKAGNRTYLPGETYVLAEGEHAVLTVMNAVVSDDGMGNVKHTFLSAGAQISMTDPDDREGYDFKGWTNGDGTPFTASSMGSEDLYAFASWEAKRFTASFDSAGAAAVPSVTVAYGSEPFALPEAPVREGSVFQGWYCDSTLYSEGTQFSIPARDVQFRAVWGTEVADSDVVFSGGSASMSSDTESIRVSKAAVDRILGTPELRQVSISMAGATLLMNPDSLKRMSDSGTQNNALNMTLTLSDTLKENMNLLPEKAGRYKEMKMVISVDVRCDGARSDLGPVTVSVPFDAAGTDPSKLLVVFLNEASGDIVRLDDFSYENGMITFVTDHFSTFAVTEEADPVPVNDPEDQKDSNTMLIIGIAAVLLVIGAAMAVIVKRGR